MGGKHKPAQRTKNNARPSSSGRSAEMLGASVPFSTVKDTSLTLPSFAQSTLKSDVCLDPTFQVVFKKFSKKDTTTKLKALQEFSELVKTNDVDVIKNILEYWTHAYGILISDIDHRIREAAHIAMIDVSQKMKKKLAPYLKQMIGPWFVSQYDTHPPVASAAKLAFEALFPPNKLIDVIVFYQEDILNYIYENLIGQSQKQFSNVKQVSDEEAQDKYERIILSNLSSYSFYLQKVPLEHIKTSEEMNLKIITNTKFWDLHKSKSQILKATFYGVLSAIGQNAPFLYEANKTKIISLVFNNLDQRDPVVVKNVWETALLIVTHIEDWWQCFNVEKLLVSKLMKVLSEAAYGNATIVYPFLILLLSNVPPVLQIEAFYLKFFENMLTGLQQKANLNTKSEVAALLSAYMECLRYIILQNVTNKIFCEKLLKEQICDLLHWNLTTQKSTSKLIFKEVASFVQYFYKNKTDDAKSLLTSFWLQTENIFESVLKEYQHDIEKLLVVTSRQVDFLKSLLDTENERKATRNRVTFSDGNETDRNEETDVTIKSSAIDLDYKNSLHFLAIKTSKNLIELIQTRKHKQFVQQFYITLQHFDEADFFETFRLEISKTLILGNWIGIYKNVFYDWLKDETICVTAVNVILLQFKYIESSEKESVLQSILDLGNDECFIYFVKKCVSEPNNKDSVVINWLLSTEVNNYICKLASKIFTEDTMENIDTLKTIFVKRNYKEFYISEETIQKVTETLHSTLKQTETKSTIEKCANFAAYLSTILYSDNFGLKFGDKLLLILADITVNCNLQTKITEAWLNSITYVLPLCEKQTAIDIIQTVYSSVLRKLSPLTDIDKEEFDYLSTFIVNTLKCAVKVTPWMVCDLILLFVDRGRFEDCRNRIEVLNDCAELIKGEATTELRLEVEELDEMEVLSVFKWLYVKSCILSAGDDDESDFSLVKFCQEEHELVWSLFYEHLLGRRYCDNYNMLKFTNVIDKLCEYSRINVWKIYNTLNEEEKIKLKQTIVEKITNQRLLSYFIKINPELTNDNIIRTIQFAEEKLNNLDDVKIRIATEKSLSPELFNLVGKLWNDNYLVRSDLCFIIEFLSVYSQIVCLKEEFSPLEKWERKIISTIKWVSENLGNLSLDKIEVLGLTNATGKLYQSLYNYRNKFSSEIPTDERYIYYNIDQHLFAICLLLSEKYSQTNEIHPIHLVFLQNLRLSITHLTYPVVDGNATDSWRRILELSTALIVHPAISIQLWAYQMLLALIPKLLQVDARTVSADDGTRLETTTLAVEHLKDVLAQTQGIVQTLLSDFKLGEDTCRVQEFTDSFTYTLAYLLLWDFLLRLCEEAATELRFQYSEWVQQDDFFTTLLSNLFRLMPPEIISHSNDTKANVSNNFISPLPTDKSDLSTSEHLEHLVCRVYASCVFQLPVLVRQWWVNTDAKVSHLVNHVTTAFVSPALCSRELNAKVIDDSKFKNMEVKVHHSVREVVAIYSVDDAHVELVITLPSNYPLGVPDIQCGSHIGRTSHRQWLKQLQMCILHQNGRIWDGLSLWNNNLDKKFDGVEECYICFAVLHPGTYQLPKLSCQTCKKKFHSPCLYKWFSTSNKSTCPICRNLF